MFKLNKKAAVLSLVISLSTVAYAATLSDNDMTQSIKNQYSTMASLNGTDIDVKTSNGVVYLSGKVANHQQYEQAIGSAQATQDVKGVNAKDLKIKETNTSLEDAYITSKVQAILLKNALTNKKDVRFSGVSVTTKNAIVTLNGTVDNMTQKQNIINVVQSVDGVKSVRSELNIK